jgi:hypothetical protein
MDVSLLMIPMQTLRTFPTIGGVGCEFLGIAAMGCTSLVSF